MVTKYYMHLNRCILCNRCDTVCIGFSQAPFKFVFYVDEDHPEAPAWLLEILKGIPILDEDGYTVCNRDFAKLLYKKRNGKADFDNKQDWFIYQEREGNKHQNSKRIKEE